MTKSFLITGGAGYIGTSLTARFLNEGARVTVFDNLITGKRNLVDTRAQFVLGDVCRYEDLEKVSSSNSFDTVIHLAALKSVGEGEKNPVDFINVNLLGTLNVLDMMKNNKIFSIVFSSTAAVYKENTAGIYAENYPVFPLSVYGSTKLMCEELIRQYERMGHIRQAIIFRYFNLAGDSGLKFFDTNAQNVFPMIARAYLENKTFSIFGENYPTPDGTGIRDYIHLDDLVEAHVLSLRKDITGIFNLGTQRGTSVRELLDEFNRYLSKPLHVNIANRRPGDVARAIANSAKARRAFNWVAKSNIEKMVQSTVEAFNVR